MKTEPKFTLKQFKLSKEGYQAAYKNEEHPDAHIKYLMPLLMNCLNSGQLRKFDNGSYKAGSMNLLFDYKKELGLETHWFSYFLTHASKLQDRVQSTRRRLHGDCEAKWAWTKGNKVLITIWNRKPGYYKALQMQRDKTKSGKGYIESFLKDIPFSEVIQVRNVYDNERIPAYPVTDFELKVKDSMNSQNLPEVRCSLRVRYSWEAENKKYAPPIWEANWGCNGTHDANHTALMGKLLVVVGTLMEKLSEAVKASSAA